MDSIIASLSSSPWLSVAIAVVGFSLLCICLYRLALPRPIPGIPYNVQATRGLLGDLPGLMKHTATYTESIDWMTMQCASLSSPIVQLFIKPFSAPWVVVSDYALAEEIMTRRFKEFDRSDQTVKILSGLIPHSTVVAPTGEEFRAKRKIWQGTMSHSFLHDVAAPRTYEEAEKLVTLWRKKSILAQNRPFEAADDIGMTTLDAIWLTTHGAELGSVKSQIDKWESVESVEGSLDKDQPVAFEKAPTPPFYEVIVSLMKSLVVFPVITKWLNTFVLSLPYYRRLWAIKERSVDEVLVAARAKFASQHEKSEKSSKSIESALDLVAERQVSLGNKPGAMLVDDRSVKDEIFMFLIAGYETTSTTLSWVMKALAAYQDTQTKLRNSLYAAFPEVDFQNGSLPTYDQLLEANLPYMEAFIMETLRVYRTASATFRQTSVDCDMLGYRIPKGTTVIVSFSGDEYLFDDSTKAPPVAPTPLSDSMPPQWDRKTMRQFNPDRWMVHKDGKEIFNPSAGPSHPFGGGLRGCFGKRLALIQMRIIIALTVLNFDFQTLPESLNDFAANENLTRVPRKCFARLRPVS